MPIITPEDYGLSWGHMAIGEDCATFLTNIITHFKIQSILEFGSGLSTLLFQNLVPNVTSYETHPEFLTPYLPYFNEHLTLKIWDGKTQLTNIGHYDMVFVDGPKDGKNRYYATQIASLISPIVIVHDGYRADDFLNQTFLLQRNPQFKTILLGGSQKTVHNITYFFCYCWLTYEAYEVPKALISKYPFYDTSSVADCHL